MKLVVSFLCVLLPSFVFAGQSEGITPNFTCMAELPTTSFYAKPIKNEDGDELVEFKVQHHFGVDNAPMFQGVVTGHDFPYLQQRLEVIKKLGNTFTVKFKKVNCLKSGDELFSCGSGSDSEINGVPVTGFGFTTRVIDTKVYEYKFKSNQVTFSFTYDGMSYDIPMQYGPDECNFKN